MIKPYSADASDWYWWKKKASSTETFTIIGVRVCLFITYHGIFKDELQYIYPWLRKFESARPNWKNKYVKREDGRRRVIIKPFILSFCFVYPFALIFLTIWVPESYNVKSKYFGSICDISWTEWLFSTIQTDSEI